MIANAGNGKSYILCTRCEGITASGERCRCYAVGKVNDIPYCRQHEAKELALAMQKTPKNVCPGAANEG